MITEEDLKHLGRCVELAAAALAQGACAERTDTSGKPQ